MSRKRFSDMRCSIAQALDQVGDWWTLLIVRDAFLGSRHFAEFHENLGIARNILTDRLQRLVTNGILVREDVEGDARRCEYRLTPKGRDLWLVMTALRLWADRWVFGPGREPILVRDERTGAEVSGLIAVDAKGRPVDPRRLVYEPGPGAAPGDRKRYRRARADRVRPSDR